MTFPISGYQNSCFSGQHSGGSNGDATAFKALAEARQLLSQAEQLTGGAQCASTGAGSSSTGLGAIQQDIQSLLSDLSHLASDLSKLGYVSSGSGYGQGSGNGAYCDQGNGTNSGYGQGYDAGNGGYGTQGTGANSAYAQNYGSGSGYTQGYNDSVYAAQNYGGSNGPYSEAYGQGANSGVGYSYPSCPFPTQPVNIGQGWNQGWNKVPCPTIPQTPNFPWNTQQAPSKPREPIQTWTPPATGGSQDGPSDGHTAPTNPGVCGTGKVWGDPHFVGANGQDYTVQGNAGSTYNLLSDQGLEVNGTFQPYGSGGANTIGEIGITDPSNNEIDIKPAGSLAINGRQITADGQYLNGEVTKSGTDITVTTPTYTIATTDGGGYLNANFTATNAGTTQAPGGIWGQSLESTTTDQNASDFQVTGLFDSTPAATATEAAPTTNGTANS